MNIVSELPTKKKQISHGHNLSVEFIRLLACFGVISIHVHANTLSASNLSGAFSIFCVPFFFSTGLVFFTSNLNNKTSVKSSLFKIWKRIGVPFVAWSTIYTCLIIAKSLLTGSNKAFTIYSLGRIYLYGESSEHLYFLPELIVMQIIILGIYLITTSSKPIIGVGLITIAMCYLAWGYMYGYYYITPVNSIIIYILVAIIVSTRLKQIKNNWHYLVVGIVLITTSVFGTYFNTIKFLEMYLFSLPLGGIGLLLLTLCSPRTYLPKWILVATSTTYGVYLSHVLFLEAIEFLIEKLHYKIFYDLDTKILMTSFIFIISILFVLIIKKIYLLRTLLLGE